MQQKGTGNKQFLNRGYSSLLLGVVVAGICLLLPEPAFAQGALTQVLCDIVNLAQGDIGRPAATAAVCAMAVMALLGRISWGALMVTAAGIAIIFSAAQIMTAITSLGNPC